MLIAMQVLVILGCLLLGVHYGGIGLGLISGVGLVVLVFAFGLTPGLPARRRDADHPGGDRVRVGVAERRRPQRDDAVRRENPAPASEIHHHPRADHHVDADGAVRYRPRGLHDVPEHPPARPQPRQFIDDIAIKNNIRPERPVAAASIASQMGITASPVSVATVSLVSILAAGAGAGESYSIPQILMISIPASFAGVLLAALWSMRRGKDLDDDPVFQAKIADPEQRAIVYGTNDTLIGIVFPKEAFRSAWIFFAGIAAVVVLGAFENLRPSYTIDGETAPLSMNLVIQMAMLVAGAAILIFCKVSPQTSTTAPSSRRA